MKIYLYALHPDQKGKSDFKKDEHRTYYPNQNTFENERLLLLYQENRQTRIILAKPTCIIIFMLLCTSSLFYSLPSVAKYLS